jgi:hypothetical protein
MISCVSPDSHNTQRTFGFSLGTEAWIMRMNETRENHKLAQHFVRFPHWKFYFFILKMQTFIEYSAINENIFTHKTK